MKDDISINNNFLNNCNNSGIDNANNSLNYYGISGTKNVNNFEECFNINKKRDSPYIKSNFIYPPLIGLENIGATDYMNSALQCFCHIEKLINFFKYNQEIINNVKQKKDSLSFSIQIINRKIMA